MNKLSLAAVLMLASLQMFADGLVEGDGEDLSLEEILTREPARSDYVDSPRCLRTGRIRQIEVIDAKHVVFKLSHKEYYLVRFKHRCPGLQRNKPVIYEPTSGSRLCNMDGIRSTYNDGLGGIRPGVRCSIPQFESVTKEQIVLLKDALIAAKRKTKTKAD